MSFLDTLMMIGGSIIGGILASFACVYLIKMDIDQDMEGVEVVFIPEEKEEEKSGDSK